MSDAHVLHFFGGKGGVGKSTLAAAYALQLSEDLPKEKVLLVSSEPVHSLSDLVKKKLSDKPSKLAAGKGEGGLFAAELDPALALKPLLTELQGWLQKTPIKGAHFTEDELRRLFAKALPAFEDLAVLLRIGAFLESGEYQRVVIDSAPTSHTLRLLDTPLALRKWLNLVKAGGSTAKKKEGPEAAVFEELQGRLERILALLKDPARTAFHLVALAEPVPESQTRQYFNQLRERGVFVQEILVNQVEDHTGCQACQGRRGLQAPHVRKFQALDKVTPVVLIARREVAPRGVDALKKLAKEWQAGKEHKALEFSPAEGPPALVRAPSMPPIAAPPLPPTRLIFFVGQGGVGKSSCAAAAAVTLTEKEGPVLLISTDPAHSLSDVLQSRLTDTETQVKGTKGLYARELDIPGWFASLKKRIKEKGEKAFEGAPKGGDLPADLLLMRNLLDSAPQGMDELAALSCLTDALVQERFKRIVVDPAPAGLGVRVVELAEPARTWLTELHAILVKHRSKGFSELADDVAAQIKHMKRFEDALASPTESRFVVVTRGEDLASLRTERLVETLKERKLQVERVLVNRVLPKTLCDKCEGRRTNELEEAKLMEKKLGLPVTVAPALGRHPAGLRELKAFRTAWYALSATAKTKAA